MCDPISITLGVVGATAAAVGAKTDILAAKVAASLNLDIDGIMYTEEEKAEQAGSGVHFARYKGDNEAQTAAGYTYKKSQGRAAKLNQEKAVNEIKSNVQQYEKGGYKFKKGMPDGWGDSRIDLIDPKGNNLGYIEYTIEDGTLSIDYIKNTTKRFINTSTGAKIAKKEGELTSTPNVAEKLIDKIMADNPDIQIKWDAVSGEGRAFKEKYLNKHPELRERVEGVSTQQELDTITENDYNTSSNGVKDNGQTGKTDNNGSGHAAILGKRTISNDKGAAPANSTQEGKLLPDGEGVLPKSDIRTDTGRNTTNNDIYPGQLTGAEVTDKMVSGEFKMETEADVDALLTRLVDDDPNVSQKTLSDLAQSYEGLVDGISENNKPYRDAFINDDIDLLNSLAQKQVKAIELQDQLAQKAMDLGIDIEDSQKAAIIDNIQHLSDYVSGIKSGSGRLLNEQKGVNKTLESFGAKRMSSWTKEGIQSFAEGLKQAIDDVTSLNFTRGIPVELKLKKVKLSGELTKEELAPYLQMLMTDKLNDDNVSLSCMDAFLLGLLG